MLDLLSEWHHMTFVPYLRVCLHYGGLPGLERISNLIPDELAYLREGLLPFYQRRECLVRTFKEYYAVNLHCTLLRCG